MHAQKAQKEYKAPKVPNNSFKLFIFFHDKILHAQKAQKRIQGTKKYQKAQKRNEAKAQKRK